MGMAPTKQRLTDYEIAVAETIAFYRRGAKISQQDLADRAGMHVNTYGYIERCERAMTVGEMRALAQALGMSVPVLLERAAAPVEVSSEPVPTSVRQPRR